MEHETFFTLLTDAAHWQFEVFLILLVDGLLAGIIWPWLKRKICPNHPVTCGCYPANLYLVERENHLN